MDIALRYSALDWSGVTIRAASTYNGNLLRNYAYETDGGAGTADDIIEIWGAGTLDYDGLEKPFSGLNAMGAIFKNVTTLRIGGGLMFRNSRKYCWLICKVQNLHADGLRFNTILRWHSPSAADRKRMD